MVFRTICILSPILLGGNNILICLILTFIITHFLFTVNSQLLTLEELEDFQRIVNRKYSRPKLNFRSVREEEVTFYLYNYAVNGSQITTDDLEMVDVSLPLVFIVHGWSSAANDSFVEELTDAYLSKGEYNVVPVDWSSPADDFYTDSAEYTRDVG